MYNKKRSVKYDPQKRPVTIVIRQGTTPETDKVAEFIAVPSLNRYYGWYADGGDPDAAKEPS